MKIYRDGNKTPVGNNLKDGSFVDENLEPSTKYSYKITTVDSSGNESSGSMVNVTTSKSESENKLPEDVTNLKGTRNGNSQNIDLSWNNPTGISHVRIYIEGNSSPIEDNIKGENSKLKFDGEVTFRVMTVDASGNGSQGVTVTIK